MKLTEKEMLTAMFEMQQRLNDETNGEGWESGYNKYGKIISWKRCIYMECAELIDSFAWKHWKNIKADPNWQNIHIEVIDIWHFVMSLALEQYYNQKLGGIEEIASYILDNKSFKMFCKEPGDIKNAEPMEIINQIERIIHVTSGSYSDTFEKIISEYFTVAHNCGLNIELLYRVYIGKNVLNGFRQDNGYKEGTYKKVWGKVEDNVVMNEIMQKNSTITPEELYNSLEAEYKKIS
jgi:dimeric dUTPase (all-alpha-NTP-PPase superfamily)